MSNDITLCVKSVKGGKSLLNRCQVCDRWRMSRHIKIIEWTHGTNNICIGIWITSIERTLHYNFSLSLEQVTQQKQIITSSQVN